MNLSVDVAAKKFASPKCVTNEAFSVRRAVKGFIGVMLTDTKIAGARAIKACRAA